MKGTWTLPRKRLRCVAALFAGCVKCDERSGRLGASVLGLVEDISNPALRGKTVSACGNFGMAVYSTLGRVRSLRHVTGTSRPALQVLPGGPRPDRRQGFERDVAARPEGRVSQGAMETRDLVRRLLGRVDAETQAAAVHVPAGGMTREDVAAPLGEPVRALRQRLEPFAALGGEELKVP
ncbi:hypothetical protein [Myxococcus sp. Y35]|uniref:hypothetical protein n=1 Tax=Pseudomyxococcus flavus TaxID=3115648 RepID=UPI003CF08E40